MLKWKKEAETNTTCRGATADEIAKREITCKEKAINRDIKMSLLHSLRSKQEKLYQKLMVLKFLMVNSTIGVETAEEVTQMQQVSAVLRFLDGSENCTN